MYLMLQQEEPDDSAIAAGESCALEELVQMAFVAAGLDRREHFVTDIGL
jgi:GDPmannose 4,6-dehydratase